MDSCWAVWPFKLHGLVAHTFEWLCQSTNLLFIVLGIFNFGDIQGREGWEIIPKLILGIQCLYDWRSDYKCPFLDYIVYFVCIVILVWFWSFMLKTPYIPKLLLNNIIEYWLYVRNVFSFSNSYAGWQLNVEILIHLSLF